MGTLRGSSGEATGLEDKQTWFKIQLFHPLPVSNISPPQFYPVLLGHKTCLREFWTINEKDLMYVIYILNK